MKFLIRYKHRLINWLYVADDDNTDHVVSVQLDDVESMVQFIDSHNPDIEVSILSIWFTVYCACPLGHLTSEVIDRRITC
jgi:hypothetical protein